MSLWRRSRAPEVRESTPYPVRLKHRDVRNEAVPEGRDTSTFDTPASDLNRARLEHLASLGLPIEGRSVLDVGGGPGHLARFFVERRCRVVSVDAI